MLVFLSFYSSLTCSKHTVESKSATVASSRRDRACAVRHAGDAGNADATHRAPDINPGINPTNTKNRELAGAAMATSTTIRSVRTSLDICKQAADMLTARPPAVRRPVLSNSCSMHILRTVAYRTNTTSLSVSPLIFLRVARRRRGPATEISVSSYSPTMSM
jgi:hypothetical protein